MMRRSTLLGICAVLLVAGLSHAGQSQYVFSTSLKDHITNPNTVNILSTSLTGGIATITLEKPLYQAKPGVKAGDFLNVDLDSPNASYDGVREILKLAADSKSFTFVSLNALTGLPNGDQPLFADPNGKTIGTAGDPPNFTRNLAVPFNKTQIVGGVVTLYPQASLFNALPGITVGTKVKVRLSAYDAAIEGVRELTNITDQFCQFNSPGAADEALKTNPGTISFAVEPSGPVGDAIAGHMIAKISVTTKGLPDVNLAGKGDDLAAIGVAITLGVGGAPIKLPLGNLAELAGKGTRTGKITGNYQASLQKKGTILRVRMNSLDMQRLLGIPAPPQDKAGVIITSGKAPMQIVIKAEGANPVTGEAISVVMAQEDVMINYKTRTVDKLNRKSKLIEVISSNVRGKGNGVPTPAAAQ